MAGDTIDETTRFYAIFVGQNKNDTKALYTLQLIAEDNNWFFEKYDHKTADFLLSISLSLGIRPDKLKMRYLKVAVFMKLYLQ